jgi:hydrogenase maturation protease
MMISVLLIGYGNPLRTDDGVGWHVAQELLRVLNAPGVEIISCVQLTPDLAEPISRAGTVIFIDAAQRGAIGQFKWESLVPQITRSSFSHELSPAALLTVARELYGASPEAALISIPGESFGFGESLTAGVAAGVPTLIARLQEFISHKRVLIGH